MTDQPLKINDTVDGKYLVLAPLGEGGMAQVYRARQIHLQVEVAVKILKGLPANDFTTRKRFQLEAKAAFQLNHPNLAKVLDFGTAGDSTYLTMELISGSDLQKVVKTRGLFSISDAVEIIVEVCKGLSYAHSNGVIHRDIKPANVMLLDSAEKPKIKILDFGIAKIMGESIELTRTGEIFGSPLYMSPEQCEGKKVDARADIYSVGCLLFYLLTGSPPFVGDTAINTIFKHVNDQPPTLAEASLGGKYPAGLESVVAKCLQKSPDDRYDDIESLQNALENALTPDKTVRLKANTVRNQHNFAYGFRKPVFIMLGALVVLGLGLSVNRFTGGPATPTRPVEVVQEAYPVPEKIDDNLPMADYETVQQLDDFKLCQTTTLVIPDVDFKNYAVKHVELASALIRGIQYLNYKNFGQAHLELVKMIRKYEAAYKSSPASIDGETQHLIGIAYGLISLSLLEQKEYDNALVHAQTAFAASAELLETYNLLGYCYDKLGKHSEAEKWRKKRDDKNAAVAPGYPRLASRYAWLYSEVASQHE